jgi:hypothetical protein
MAGQLIEITSYQPSLISTCHCEERNDEEIRPPKKGLCFAEFVVGQAKGPTRWLAMTETGRLGHGLRTLV